MNVTQKLITSQSSITRSFLGTIIMLCFSVIFWKMQLTPFMAGTLFVSVLLLIGIFYENYHLKRIKQEGGEEE